MLTATHSLRAVLTAKYISVSTILLYFARLSLPKRSDCIARFCVVADFIETSKELQFFKFDSCRKLRMKRVSVL